MKDVSIAGRPIGPGHPPYVIAELSGNHNGDLRRAFEIIQAAHDAGADAVKLQTYTPDTITIDHNGPGFTMEGGLWDGRTLYNLYTEAHTPWDWHADLFAKGRELGITVFSSPFDSSAIDLLESLDTPAYKISSFEIVDLPLIRYAARTGKPIIISTGMANLGEMADAVAIAGERDNGGVVLLHCVSGYPTPFEDMNLRTIPHMAEMFDVIPGLSDHSHGVAASVAAVALGACVIEKHVTMRRSDGGPDAAFSLEPDELKALVRGVRDAHAALGSVVYGPVASEKTELEQRRSLYAVRDIAAGEVLNHENIRSIRPGFGLAPRHFDTLIGRQARCMIAKGTPLTWGLID
jgi:N-acetylneuraminate synthase